MLLSNSKESPAFRRGESQVAGARSPILCACGDSIGPQGMRACQAAPAKYPAFFCCCFINTLPGIRGGLDAGTRARRFGKWMGGDEQWRYEYTHRKRNIFISVHGWNISVST